MSPLPDCKRPVLSRWSGHPRYERERVGAEEGRREYRLRRYGDGRDPDPRTSRQGPVPQVGSRPLRVVPTPRPGLTGATGSKFGSDRGGSVPGWRDSDSQDRPTAPVVSDSGPAPGSTRASRTYPAWTPSGKDYPRPSAHLSAPHSTYVQDTSWNYHIRDSHVPLPVVPHLKPPRRTPSRPSRAPTPDSAPPTSGRPRTDSDRGSPRAPPPSVESVLMGGPRDSPP